MPLTPGLQNSVLPRYRILQVGDLHYPEWTQEPAPIDVKSAQVDGAVVDAMRTGGLQNILRFLADRDLLNSCDAVIFMGDFTSKGDRPSLERAISQVAHLLGINPQSPSRKFFAVPGNHDVNREVALASDMSRKFDEMNELLMKQGFEGIPKLLPVIVKTDDPRRPVQIILMNTTLGSWERVGLPKVVIDTIDALMQANTDPSINGTVPISNPTEYYDQLDMPFVSSETLTTTQDAITGDIQRSIPVIVGHHNLLSQAIPRVSPFAELLNQGEIRDTFLRLDRPMIYLHGHTHDEPITVCTSPDYPGGQVISISAPKIDEGVNIIDIHFDRQGEAIGISATGIRPDGRGNPRPRPARIVPLIAASRALLRSPLSRDIYKILTAQSRLNWASLREHEPLRDIPEDDLEAALQELRWGLALRILNEDAPRQRWIIEAVQ